MKLGNILNLENTRELPTEYNAYIRSVELKNSKNVYTQSAEKILFPEPYENAPGYYNKSQFCPPPKPEPKECKHHTVPSPMFDFKAILPMLLGGKFNDVLSPLMSMIGGKSGGMDIAKIFELLKPKTSVGKGKKKSEIIEEDVSSKFDDMIIIED